jgi:hypothetical protein
MVAGSVSLQQRRLDVPPATGPGSLGTARRRGPPGEVGRLRGSTEAADGGGALRLRRQRWTGRRGAMQAEAAGVRVRGSRPLLYRVRRSRPGLARKPKAAAAAVSWLCLPWPASDWAQMGLARRVAGPDGGGSGLRARPKPKEVFFRNYF